MRRVRPDRGRLSRPAFCRDLSANVPCGSASWIASVANPVPAPHKGELTHCWLLATIGSQPEAQGSLLYAKLLAEYLKQRHGIQCNFYYGDNYTISLDEDSQVLGKTYDLVQQVFKEVRSKNLSAREIVADFTTGFRSMTLGMILACLDEERDIEFIGTHYNETGKPDGSLIPIIFSFKPQSRLESI